MLNSKTLKEILAIDQCLTLSHRLIHLQAGKEDTTVLSATQMLFLRIRTLGWMVRHLKETTEEFWTAPLLNGLKPSC